MTHEDTTEQVVEMNRAIAEFDGWECYEDRFGIWFKRGDLIKCLHPKLQDLSYHSDWSWLMPVWIKFRNLNIDSKEYSEWLSSLGWYLYCADEPKPFFERLYYAIAWYNTRIKKES